ncbi:MAG: hypothetical protein QXG98_02065 [Candidatus Micrarchaeia archaeon]
MASVSEELRENDVLLVKVAPENYAASLVSVLGQLGRGGRTCILLLSRPYSAIAKKLGRGGDYFFIAIGEVPNGLGVGVDSPGNLSDLGIAFSTALRQKCSAALLESVSLLFIHAEYNSVMRFLFDLVAKARGAGSKMVFLLSREDEHAKELYPFVDKIIALNG